MAKRGGKRRGAGRKKDVSKDLKVGAEIAQRILKELHHEKALQELYRTCGDARLKAHIILRLWQWAFVMPVQATNPLAFDPEKPLKVLVEHIGRPQDQAAAKTK